MGPGVRIDISPPQKRRRTVPAFSFAKSRPTVMAAVTNRSKLCSAQEVRLRLTSGCGSSRSYDARMDASITQLLNLSGKTAVVTGAATGIGEGIARTLSGAGARIIVADIDIEGAQRVAAELAGDAVDLDVSDPDACAQILSTIGDRIDILVNNAGSYHEAGSILDQKCRVVAPFDRAQPCKSFQLLQTPLPLGWLNKVEVERLSTSPRSTDCCRALELATTRQRLGRSTSLRAWLSTLLPTGFALTPSVPVWFRCPRSTRCTPARSTRCGHSTHRRAG